MPGALWRLLKKLKAYFRKKKKKSTLLSQDLILLLSFCGCGIYRPAPSLPAFTAPPPLQHLVPFQQFSSRGISCRLCLAALSVTGKEGCAAPPPSPPLPAPIPHPQPTFFPYPTFSPACSSSCSHELLPPDLQSQDQNKTHARANAPREVASDQIRELPC